VPVESDARRHVPRPAFGNDDVGDEIAGRSRRGLRVTESDLRDDERERRHAPKGTNDELLHGSPPTVPNGPSDPTRGDPSADELRSPAERT